jgi:hypothetical protein
MRGIVSPPKTPSNIAPIAAGSKDQDRLYDRSGNGKSAVTDPLDDRPSFYHVRGR